VTYVRSSASPRTFSGMSGKARGPMVSWALRHSSGCDSTTLSDVSNPYLSRKASSLARKVCGVLALLAVVVAYLWDYQVFMGIGVGAVLLASFVFDPPPLDDSASRPKAY
jgi:hypothetical protein